MNRHIGEFAELYALGSLEARKRATVELHVRTCVACANRIRAAEETIAFIAGLEVHHEPPRPSFKVSRPGWQGHAQPKSFSG
jgi:hypothetical protein